VEVVAYLHMLTSFLRSDAYYSWLVKQDISDTVSYRTPTCAQAIGVVVQNGYGMTESSPVTAARRPSNNVRYIHYFRLLKLLHLFNNPKIYRWNHGERPIAHQPHTLCPRNDIFAVLSHQFGVVMHF
jgi:acyl-CoA synthetase (AMP-forming)/AMP-acid ligase II